MEAIIAPAGESTWKVVSESTNGPYAKTTTNYFNDLDGDGNWTFLSAEEVETSEGRVATMNYDQHYQLINALIINTNGQFTAHYAFGSDWSYLGEAIQGNELDNRIIANEANENLFGGDGNDQLWGMGNNDMLSGDRGNDRLYGGDGRDTLYGGDGNDQLYGGRGQDVLSGGSGRDTFVFQTMGNKAKSHLDRITDFTVKDDSLWLENAVFRALEGKGSEAKPAALQKGFFTTGTHAKDADDHLIYSRKTGALFYDKDGAGGAAQVQIATLSKGLKLTYHDFFVV